MYQPDFLPVVVSTLKAKEDLKRARLEAARQEEEANEDTSTVVSCVDTIEEETLKKVDITTSKGMPIVPPKSLKSEIEEEEDEVWFFVQSPREQHGAVGPFSIDELRSYRRLGKLHDTTLMWTSEFVNWKPLGNITTLKNKLLTLPPIPEKLRADKRIDDPIVDIPSILNKDECKKLDLIDKYTVSLSCSKCGTTAVTHLPETGEQRPDFKVLRQPMGNYQDASEVVPGLLWIGNASTGRSKFFVRHGFDLSINCTDNLKTPPSKPPHYRCKQIPFKEEKIKEKDNMSSRSFKSLNSNVSALTVTSPPTLEETLQFYDMFYDMVEIARVSPERLQEEDLRPPDYRGSLDRYGRPLRTKEEAALWKATMKNKTYPRLQFKILAWSRLGFDRPCAASVAYLIRKWGMTIDHALDIISIGRIGTNISPHYLEALEVYSVRHTLGDMLCTDCAVTGLTRDERSKDQNMRISEMEHHLPDAEKDVYNRLLAAGQSSPNYSTLMGKIIEIKSMFNLHRGYVNQPRLMELRLPGRKLNDEDITNLSAVLSEAGVLPHICLLDLSTNCIQSPGISSLCASICKACPPKECELTCLFLQHNKIGPEGGDDISRLLHPGYIIHTLNVEDNMLGDEGVGRIALSLVVPEKDLFEDEGGEEDLSHLPPDVLENVRKQQQKQEEEDAKILGNQTITSLNVSNNNFGRETFDNLSQVMKTNKALKTLNLDCIFTVKPKDIVNFVNCCKVYNKSLKELTMTDTLLPASVVGMIFKVMNSSSVLSRLSLARCGLTDLHVLRNAKLLGYSKHLTHLSLCGNSLSDDLIPALCEGLEGQIDHDSGLHIPPIENIDMSDCGITIKGALQIVKTVSGRGCMKSLDLSSNDLHVNSDDEIKDFVDALQTSTLHTINFNRCRLGTKFCEHILLALKSIDTKYCGFHLRRLLLSENNIHDSVDKSLYSFLSENTQIQLLDIGFNKLTWRGLKESQEAIKVYSSSDNARKLHDLHINLLGNPCEREYLLDYPGMARSKVTLRFGHETKHQPMEHIQQDLREHYIERIHINGGLVIDQPTSSFVKFNDCA